MVLAGSSGSGSSRSSRGAPSASQPPPFSLVLAAQKLFIRPPKSSFSNSCILCACAFEFARGEDKFGVALCHRHLGSPDDLFSY